MPVMAVSLNGVPLFKYEETSPTTTAELIAAVEATANETTTSVDRLIMNAMTTLLRRNFLLRGSDDGLEKYCVTYLILTEPVPSTKGIAYTKPIAEWLPAFDFNVNIIGHEDGFVLEIAKSANKFH